MKVKIEIDTKTFIRFWLVIFGFLVIAGSVWLAKDALILAVIALFLALALNSPVAMIAKILPGSNKNRVGATAVAFLTIVVVLGGLIFLLAPIITEQAIGFANNLPNIVQDISGSNSSVRRFIADNHLEGMVSQGVDSISNTVNSSLSNLGNILFGSIASIIGWIVSLFMILTMTFLMLVEGPSWVDKFFKLYSDKTMEKQHRRILNRLYSSISKYTTSIVTVCAISACCGSIVTIILGYMFKFSISLVAPVGLMLFILGMIPMFGATIAGVLSGLLIALNSPIAGLIFVGYFLIYQQIENNVISPMIQAKNNSLSALIIFVSLTIGIYAFGLLGALFAIPFAACVKILIQEYLTDKRRRKKLQRDSNEKIIELLNKMEK